MAYLISSILSNCSMDEDMTKAIDTSENVIKYLIIAMKDKNKMVRKDTFFTFSNIVTGSAQEIPAAAGLHRLKIFGTG